MLCISNKEASIWFLLPLASIKDRVARKQSNGNLSLAPTEKEVTSVPPKDDKDDKEEEVKVEKIKRKIEVAEKDDNDEMLQAPPVSSESPISEVEDSSALLIDLFERVNFESFNSTPTPTPTLFTQNDESAVKTTLNTTSMASPSSK